MSDASRPPGEPRTDDVVASHGDRAAITQGLSATAGPLSWEDFPRETLTAAARCSPVVAEAAEYLPGPQVTDNGRTVELAVGWRMHEDAVVLARVQRHVSRAVAGYWLPGSWKHVDVRVRHLAGPLRRRQGLVAVPVDRESGKEGTPSGTTANREHACAAEAWRDLPEVVRTSAERLVPEPVVWLGESIPVVARRGWPLGQRVRVLRMDGTRALVVLADRSLPPDAESGVDTRWRQLARTPWLVEQVGADLAPRDPGGIRA